MMTTQAAYLLIAVGTGSLLVMPLAIVARSAEARAVLVAISVGLATAFALGTGIAARLW